MQEGGDVVLDRVIAVFSNNSQRGAFQLAGRVQIVGPLQTNLNCAQVRFVSAGLRLYPWKRDLAFHIPANVNTAAMNIVGNVLQFGMDDT